MDKGTLGLDTGMPEDIVVHSPEMAIHHRREAGSDIFLGGGDTAHSPDYTTTFDGVDFGPFHFPRMDGIGRDRDQRYVPGGIALVGMGMMRYFRVAFDLQNQELHVWPGDGYKTLRRAGMDIEDGDGPFVDRVIQGGPADDAGIERGDVILAVAHDFRAHDSAASARRAFAGAPGTPIAVWVERRGTPRKLQMLLDPAYDLEDPAEDPITLKALRRAAR